MKRATLFNRVKKAGAVLLKRDNTVVKEFSDGKALLDFLFRTEPEFQWRSEFANHGWSIEPTDTVGLNDDDKKLLRSMGIQASKVAVVKQQYGSPTPENPILPMQPPQEQEESMESSKEAAADSITAGQLAKFFSGFDPDASVEVVSAASTSPDIVLPIYEFWNAGGRPKMTIDTDPFYEYVQKGKRAARTPQVPAIPGMTPLGLPERREPQITTHVEARNRRLANKEIIELCRSYQDGIPVGAIRDILTMHGFNGEAMDGIYTGYDGKIHEQVGPKTWISMTWHKLENTGKYEIVAYLS